MGQFVRFFIFNLLLIIFTTGLHLKTEKYNSPPQKSNAHDQILNALESVGQAIVGFFRTQKTVENVVQVGQEIAGVEAATAEKALNAEEAAMSAKKVTEAGKGKNAVTIVQSITSPGNQGLNLLVQLGLAALPGFQLKQVTNSVFQKQNITIQDCLQVESKCVDDIMSQKEDSMLSKCNQLGNFCIQKINGQK